MTRLDDLLGLQRPKGSCAACGVHHEPNQPHDALSEYYQKRFHSIRHRLPTWADAIAHCPPREKQFWRTELKSRNKWTQPGDQQPIADPPGETVEGINGFS